MLLVNEILPGQGLARSKLPKTQPTELLNTCWSRVYEDIQPVPPQARADTSLAVRDSCTQTAAAVQTMEQAWKGNRELLSHRHHYTGLYIW